MKQPKVKTIEKNIRKYAEMIGWTVSRNHDGTYTVYDSYYRSNRWENISRMNLVSEIYCELNMLLVTQ